MKYSVVLLILFSLIVAGCGNSGGSHSDTKKVTTITEQQIQGVMNNQVMECGSLNGSACPEGVARLLLLNKENADKSAVCSGFMIGEDTLVTNWHCISNAKACENTYVAIYNGYAYEKTKCKSIVKTMNDFPNPNDPRKKIDVAVIKLEDRFYGKTFKLAQKRPSQSEKVTVWAVDHVGLDRMQPNLVESRITEFTCTVANDHKHESLMLSNCPMISGNSGSPVVNSTGEIVGIIWGGTGTRYHSNIDLGWRRQLPESAAVTEVKYISSIISSTIETE